MRKKVICIGATLIDELYFCENIVIKETSNPAKKQVSIGGVISNIAQHLALLDVNTSIITAIGNDAEGNYILNCLKKNRVLTEKIIIANDTTGKYVSILAPTGDMFVAVCQDNCQKYISVPFLEKQTDYINEFDILVIDTNLDIESIKWLIEYSNTYKKLLIIEPVSVLKASKLAAIDLSGVFMITPNEEELASLCPNYYNGEDRIAELLKKGIKSIWLRKGPQGSEIITLKSKLKVSVPKIDIIDSTGAGDAALAGWIFGYLQSENNKTCLELAHSMAIQILKTKGAIYSKLTREALYKNKEIYYNE